MLDIKRIQANAEEVKNALAKKGCAVDFTELLAWDAQRRARIAETERLKAERNRVSAEIPKRKKAGEDVSEIFVKMRALGEEVEKSDKEIAELESRIFDFLSVLPNLPDDDLRAGEKENNEVVRVVGKRQEEPHAIWMDGSSCMPTRSPKVCA